MMQKSANFHYDFACKKVPLSLRYAKNIILNNNREEFVKHFEKKTGR
jgi:hypothetical protein